MNAAEGIDLPFLAGHLARLESLERAGVGFGFGRGGGEGEGGEGQRQRQQGGLQGIPKAHAVLLSFLPDTQEDGSRLQIREDSGFSAAGRDRSGSRRPRGPARRRASPSSARSLRRPRRPARPRRPPPSKRRPKSAEGSAKAVRAAKGTVTRWRAPPKLSSTEKSSAVTSSPQNWCWRMIVTSSGILLAQEAGDLDAGKVGAEPDVEVVLAGHPVLGDLLDHPAHGVAQGILEKGRVVDSVRVHGVLRSGPARVRQTAAGLKADRSVPAGVQGPQRAIRQSGLPAPRPGAVLADRPLAVVAAGGLEPAVDAEAPHPRRERRLVEMDGAEQDSGPRAGRRGRAPCRAPAGAARASATIPILSRRRRTASMRQLNAVLPGERAGGGAAQPEGDEHGGMAEGQRVEPRPAGGTGGGRRARPPRRASRGSPPGRAPAPAGAGGRAAAHSPLARWAKARVRPQPGQGRWSRRRQRQSAVAGSFEGVQTWRTASPASPARPASSQSRASRRILHAGT